MYRRVFYSLYRARRRAAAEAGVLTKCDMPPLTVYRVVNGGVKALNTTSLKYCEKNGTLPPKQDGKSSTSMEGKVDHLENKVTEMSQQVSVVGVVNSESNKCTSEERIEVKLEEGKVGERVMEAGLVQTEAASTIPQMDVIMPEVQMPKESASEASEERLEIQLEESSSQMSSLSSESESKVGESIVEPGLVQTEADNPIQQIDITGTPEVQKPKESIIEASEERLEIRIEESSSLSPESEGKVGESIVDAAVVQSQTGVDCTIQQIDVIGTPEVQKPKECTSEASEERLEVRLEEGSDREGVVEIGTVQTEVDDTIQQVDISMPEVQMSKESTSEERIEVAEDVEVMVQAETDGTKHHMDDVSPPEILKNTEHGEKKRDPPKSSKESLLDLLGSMKVQVTSKKRRFKDTKDLQSSTPKPASMESMGSMFQKATEEASAQSDTVNAADSALAEEEIENVKDLQSSTPKPAPMERVESMFQKVTGEASVQSDTLNPELIAAASAAAATLPNRSKAESELLRQLRRHEAVAEDQKKGDVNSLGGIIADMKVGRVPNRKNWPSHQIRFDDDGQGYVHDRGITAELSGARRRTKLFSEKRLGIFSPTVVDGEESAIVRPTLWDIDFTNQIVLSTNQSPRNALEEMIQWTKEGKLWEYPINNEAGLEEEMSVPFHEHIFLEKHLVEGFPQQGPVRHFMELVVAGLAKNSHLTVQQKKDHISWFRDYFHQKEDVLKEADVYLN